MRRIFTKKQFAEQRLGRTVRHLERLLARGEGPPVVRLGPRAVGIDEADGEAWIASRRVLPPGWQDGRPAVPEGAPLPAHP
jgi:predicted DNA-binding transcriptional regulator AlpA